MCRKMSHKSTYGAAQHVLALMRKQKRARNKSFGIYYCGECDAYHITSKGDNRCIAIINKNI